MFLIDEQNTIKLTKGDTATMLISAHDLEGNVYEFKPTDVIKMTIKDQYSSTIRLTKTADAEHYIIINPSDTSSLDVKNYVYDVQVTTGDGNVYTIIPCSMFMLTCEVSQ